MATVEDQLKQTTQQLTEDAARAVLARAGSEASNPEYFSARRRENGWVFGWREDRGDVPVGTRPWIVADNGHAVMLGYRDDKDDALALALTGI